MPTGKQLYVGYVHKGGAQTKVLFDTTAHIKQHMCVVNDKLIHKQDSYFDT